MVQDITTKDYTYTLPEEYIAKYPLSDRGASRLLVAKPKDEHCAISEHIFRDIVDILPSEAVLVRNNSKVIHARLLFRKETGAQVEIFCLEPISPTSYELSLQSHESCTWHCMMGNAKRWRVDGEVLVRKLSHPHYGEVVLSAKRVAHDKVYFSWDNPQFSFGSILESMGILPIPPYLNRETEESDDITYQTVYAEREGSVAAPTAGLHFTPQIFTGLNQRGIKILDVTLHVGAGTFLPVKSDTIGEHEMHKELISVNRTLIEELYNGLGHIVAVGTTSVRTLESLYHLGVELYLNPDRSVDTPLAVAQWEAYEHQNKHSDINASMAIDAIRRYMDRHDLTQLVFPTVILIAPGYVFRIVEALVTNFHQPDSTLLLLIAAFVGDGWREIYNYALAQKFRFLSYGDSSLLFKKQ